MTLALFAVLLTATHGLGDRPVHGRAPRIVLRAAAPTTPANAVQKVDIPAASKPELWRRTLIAYALWFFAGMGGAHHAYLGRNREAVVYALTFGGLGAGWLADALLIPRYVHALANAEAAAVAAATTPRGKRTWSGWRRRRFRHLKKRTRILELPVRLALLALSWRLLARCRSRKRLARRPASA